MIRNHYRNSSKIDYLLLFENGVKLISIPKGSVKLSRLEKLINNERRETIDRHQVGSAKHHRPPFFSPADFHRRIRIFPIPAGVAGVSGGCPICRCLRNLGCCLAWDASGVSLTPGYLHAYQGCQSSHGSLALPARLGHAAQSLGRCRPIGDPVGMNYLEKSIMIMNLWLMIDGSSQLFGKYTPVGDAP